MYSPHCDYKSGANPTYYNFTKSILCRALQEGGSVYNMLPNDLLKEIVTVNKNVAISSDSGNSYIAQPYKAKLFSLAHDEILNNDPYAVSTEGTKYRYYQTHTTTADYIKYAVGGSAYNYWLRSPSTYYNNSAWRFLSNGSIGVHIVNAIMNAVAPAFCI